MTLTVLRSEKEFTRQFQGEGLESIAEIQAQIERFKALVEDGDRITILVTLKIGGESAKALNENSPQSVFLRMAIDHFGTIPKFVRHYGFTRTSYYNWAKGLPISGKNLRKLIAQAPNEELKVAAQNLV